MKKKLITIMTVALMLMGCGYVEDKESSVQAGGNSTADSIRVGVLRTADSLPIYVGEKTGLFEKYGVNVELVEFSSASNQSKAIEGGAIDGMMTDMVVQNLLIKGGTDLRAVATALGENVAEGKFLIVSSPNSGIESIEDVEGKKIGISEGTMMEYLVDSYWSELGLDINKIEKVNIPSLSLRFETLNADEIDLAILPDPMGDLAIAGGCKEIVNDTTLKNNYSVTVIAFTKKFTDENESVVRKFMEGYNAAVDRINEHNDEDLELIHYVANVPEALQGTWQIPHYPKNSVPTQEEVENITKWMVEKNLLNKTVDYDQVVDTQFGSEEGRK